MIARPSLPMSHRSHAGRPVRLAAALCTGVLLAVCAATPSWAQVFMDCKPVASPSAYPADWRSTHSLCRLVMTNQAGEPVTCDLRVQMDQNGGSATATERRFFPVGQTMLLTPQVINWDRLQFAGEIQRAIDRTGHLPAKPLRIVLHCENMTTTISHTPIPAVQIEIDIIPSVPSPPTLLMPSDGSQVRAQAPVFNWTPVRLTTGQELWYLFRLVRVLPGQSPARAIEANYPVLETIVHQASLPYPATAPRLEDGALYAWRVQALINSDSGIGKAPTPGNLEHLGLNEGLSRAYTFLWQSPNVALRVGGAAGGSASARVGALDHYDGPLGVGTDAHPAPAAAPSAEYTPAIHGLPTPADSLTLALFHPRHDFWGPSSGGRELRADGSYLPPRGVGTTATGATDAASTPPADPTPAEPASTGPVTTEAPLPSAGAPPRMPIAVDGNLPQGAGVATRWLRISGTSVAAGELYGHTGAGVPSRPDQNGQMMAGVTLGLFNDRLNVPLRALVSGDQVSFRQSINQVSLHPEWHWGGLHAGNYNPGYSAFSLADASVLGGGADIVRGRWYAGFVNGSVQRAIPPDSVNAVEARFARNVVAGRFGLGEPLGNAIEIEVMRARDDQGSLRDGDSLVRVAPAGNMVFGARARHTVFDTTTTVQLEGAWSRFERNIRADVPITNGAAVSAKIQRRTFLGEIGAAVDYVGGGFVTLGNSDLAPDCMEGRLTGRRDLFAGKLRLGGTLGLRKDDISGTLGGSTRRQSIGVQAGWQPTLLFGTDLDCGLLTSRAPGTDLRGSLKDVTNTFTMSPHLVWNWGGSTQTLSSSLCLQATDFSDADARGFLNSKSTTVVGGWQGSVTRFLFVNVSGNYIRSSIGDLLTEIGSGGPGLSMTLLGGRVQTNLQLLVTQTHVERSAIDRDLAPNIDARFIVSGRQSLVFRAGWRKYRTGASDVGNFDEHQATLQYSAAL